MESLFSELGINWKLLVTQIVNFGILVGILRWLLYKPLLDLLEKRRKKLEEDETRSKAIEAKFETAKAEEELMLKDARQKGQKLLLDAENSAKSLRDTLVRQAQSEAQSVITAGKRALDEDRVKLHQEIRKEIGSVVAVAIEQSLGDVLDKKVQEKLQGDAVEKIKAAALKK